LSARPAASTKNHCVNRREEGFLSGILEGIKEIRHVLRDSCHEWRLTNYKVVNGCTLLGLQEESSFHEWEEAMGQDSVHLTESGYGKMAEEIFQISEGFEAVFSGGKRERGRRRRRSRTPSSLEGSCGCMVACLDRGEGDMEAVALPEEETWWIQAGKSCWWLRLQPCRQLQYSGYSGYAGNKR
jgi:hypothetical protein